MTSESRQVLKEALELPPVARAELVEQILASFDFPPREEIDKLWAEEAESRIDAHERGDIGSKPAKRMFDAVDERPTS